MSERAWPDPDCPTCGATIPVGVPYGATLKAVSASPDPDAEATLASTRRRKLIAQCPNDHLAHVYYTV